MKIRWKLFVCLFILTVNFSTYAQQPMPGIKVLKFTNDEISNFVIHKQSPDDAYLARLRTEYKLDEVAAGKKTEYEKIQTVSRWVRTRWEHNGSNEPRKSDAISILEEAATGKQFRCVEYSIVLSAALNSIGIPARVLNLKTEDAETRESGAGHVVAEAYLKDSKKWIMVDGQWDVIPTLKGKPLNAVEFQKAIAASNAKLSVVSFSGVKTEDYLKWVAPYLFYFSTNVEMTSDSAKHELYLKPIGAKDLGVFQRKYPLKNSVFTNSVKAFYAKPG